MDNRLRVTIILAVASIISITLTFLPIGATLLFPLQLFVTFVHEMCHAMTAWLTGGRVHHITINPDMSGTTITSGGIFWLISSAGYVGTVIVGATCIHLMRKGVSPSWILSGFIALLLIALFYTGVGSIYGTVWSLVFIGAILLMIKYLSQTQLEMAASFISVQLLLNAFYDLKTLFMLSGSAVQTDASNMQGETGIPAVVWACGWIALSGYAAYRILLRKPGTETGAEVEGAGLN